MKREHLLNLVALAHTRQISLLEGKGQEYSGPDDALANFKRLGASLALRPETVLLVYATKHWDSITSYVRNLSAETAPVLSEPIEERLADLCNYMMLLQGLIAERAQLNASIGANFDADLQELRLAKRGPDIPYAGNQQHR